LSSTFSFFLENLSSFTYFIQMRPRKAQKVIVVTDSTVLIGLAKLGRLTLL
jgi:hypothetical protein